MFGTSKRGASPRKITVRTPKFPRVAAQAGDDVDGVCGPSGTPDRAVKTGAKLWHTAYRQSSSISEKCPTSPVNSGRATYKL